MRKSGVFFLVLLGGIRVGFSSLDFGFGGPLERLLRRGDGARCLCAGLLGCSDGFRRLFPLSGGLLLGLQRRGDFGLGLLGDCGCREVSLDGRLSRGLALLGGLLLAPGLLLEGLPFRVGCDGGREVDLLTSTQARFALSLSFIGSGFSFDSGLSFRSL